MVTIKYKDGTERKVDAATLKEAAEKSKEDLRGADLHGKELFEEDLRGVDLSRADLREANLRWANLSGANLCWANLNGADLRGAKLEYSSWPLWCGSLDVKIDARIARQLMYHTLRAMQSVDTEEVKEILRDEKLIKFANGFHLASECGKLEVKKGSNK